MNETNRVAAALGESQLLRAGLADVTRVRERTRRRRIIRLIVILTAADAFLWWRNASGHPLHLPHLPAGWGIWLPAVLLILLFGLMMLMPLASGRSPHILIRSEEHTSELQSRLHLV